MTRRLLVLGWHNIKPTWAFHGWSAADGIRGFDRQLRVLRRWARVVPLQAALADLAAGRPLLPRTVALTFDDGYLDNATVAGPLLRHHGLPATFFLVSGFLTGTERAWWEELGWGFAHATATHIAWAGERLNTSTAQARHASQGAVAEGLKTLDRLHREDAIEEILVRLAPFGPRFSDATQFLDWNDARGLLQAGHSIGSHTCSHPILSRETGKVQASELVSSKLQLEIELQWPVDVLAFPNGRECDYDATTLRLVREAGYRHALTTRAGLVAPDHSPYEVRRVVLEPRTDLSALLVERVRVAKRTARFRWGATR